MTIKEFIKDRAENSSDEKMKYLFIHLKSLLEEKEQTYIQYKPHKTQNIVDNIDGLRIFILPEYKKGSTQPSTNTMKNGYKSKINDDIVADDGTIYEKIGEYQQYNFYKNDKTYFLRFKGANVLSVITEENYSKYKEFTDFVLFN